MIERLAEDVSGPAELPAPTDTDRQLTILDAGWDLMSITSAGGWLATALTRCPLLIVTSATVPGLRSLALTTQTHQSHPRPHAAVVGAARKRWPKSLRAAAATSSIEDMAQQNRLHTIPTDRDLQCNGLSAAQLPPALATAATTVLERLTAESTERKNP